MLVQIWDFLIAVWTQVPIHNAVCKSVRHPRKNNHKTKYF
jgi:hypothetical protein